jgi:hypothetical protein
MTTGGKRAYKKSAATVPLEPNTPLEIMRLLFLILKGAEPLSLSPMKALKLFNLQLPKITRLLFQIMRKPVRLLSLQQPKSATLSTYLQLSAILESPNTFNNGCRGANIVYSKPI